MKLDLTKVHVPIDIKLTYLKQLREHIAAVREAGMGLDVPLDQLDHHDDSKFGAEELPGYALHLCGGGAPEMFSKAWLHHIHNNPHHWQYWIFPDGYHPDGTSVEHGVVYMPEHYALEMVADWMGASYVYTGSWDMADWLRENKPRIIVHSETGRFLDRVLSDLGYGSVVATRAWKSLYKES